MYASKSGSIPEKLAKTGKFGYNVISKRTEGIGMKVIVIGGGAAGLAAAVAAVACGDQVMILERMDRVGKKLLATGNGRCNLMNTGKNRYPGGEKFASLVLASFGAAKQRVFWENLGLRLRQEEGGRVYPVSGQASSVLDCLRLELTAQGVKIVTGTRVTGLTRRGRHWLVMAAEQRYEADRVIVAGGGCAQPKLGSDGSAAALLQSLGESLIPMKPALTQVMTETAPLRGLSGIRVKAAVRVMDGNRMLHQEEGEVLLADYGVSGVCVMQCARYAEAGTTLRIDLVRGMGFEDAAQLRREIQRRRKAWARRPMGELLTGLCVPRLASALMRSAGVRGDICSDLTADMAERLVRTLSSWELKVTGIRGFDSAQVTTGGISPEGFDPRTLESRRNAGLHAAGEVLDVDGDCGGFNLMFAFGSGVLAGLNGREAPWVEK